MPRGLAIGWAILPLLALVGGGCGTQEREARARAVAEAYFQAVKDQDMERALTFFATPYLEARGAEGLKADLRLITTRLGALEGYALRGARSRTDFVPPDSGTHVTLQYEVRYARHAAAETFVVFKPFARGEYRFVAHTITSRGLLGE
jgi:hypothetical protein